MSSAFWIAVLLAQSTAAPESVIAPTVLEPLPAVVAVQPSDSAPVRLPVGTTLVVEVVQGLDSRTSTLGQRFPIKLAEPIVKDGIVLAEAGALGEGEVLDVAKAGFGGKQGKLVVAARTLELAGQTVRVRGMSMLRAGESRVDLATGALIVAPAVVFFIEGSDIAILPGARATVRLAEPVDIAPPAAPAAPVSTPEGSRP